MDSVLLMLQNQIDEIKKNYMQYLSKTKMKYFILNTEGENLSEQILQIIGFLNAVIE